MVLLYWLILPCILYASLTESNTWSVPETKGAVPQGGYGHSSTYDAGSGSVYVHGGYKALPANKYGLFDDLYRYEVNTRTWLVNTYIHTYSMLTSVFVIIYDTCHASRFILKESGFPRYLHSAVLLSGTLLIFGGNTHNDTSLSNGAKCFSADFLAYDIGRPYVILNISVNGDLCCHCFTTTSLII